MNSQTNNYKIYFILVVFMFNNYNGFSFGINKDTKVDTSEVIRIGGINQFVNIKYENEANPILLFVHGGPGRSLMGSADTFNDELVKEFIVVHWDQRKSGKTDELNKGDVDLSLKLFISDTYELVTYLLRKYNKKKVYLVSHSWGSEIAFPFVSKYPELIHAFIPISPVIDQHENTRLTVSMLKTWATSRNDSIALSELQTINIPIEEQKDLYFQQKWLFIHNREEFATKENFKDTYYNWMNIWFPLVLEASQKNLFEKVPSLKCPVYFIEGNGDKQEIHLLSKKYFDYLDAEIKKFYWFTKSGHTVFNTEPKKLQNVIIEISKNL